MNASIGGALVLARGLELEHHFALLDMEILAGRRARLLDALPAFGLEGGRVPVMQSQRGALVLEEQSRTGLDELHQAAARRGEPVGEAARIVHPAVRATALQAVQAGRWQHSGANIASRLAMARPLTSASAPPSARLASPSAALSRGAGRALSGSGRDLQQRAVDVEEQRPAAIPGGQSERAVMGQG
jgi:hypothetical protein